jgi:peptidoglycan/xylan/chitin deacetylase (PgdA/CDA1 family)
MSRLRFAIACVAASMSLSVVTKARASSVALTFDDLPALSIVRDQNYIDYLNLLIIRGLKRHRFPATGFVNEGKLDEGVRRQQIANLKRWVDAGMVLGNHTFSHESPNSVGAKNYIADIRRGEPAARDLMARHGQRLRWFRHPFLETGYPGSAKREINEWLLLHRYWIAPVTIDADDWEFAEPYDDAIRRNDLAGQRHIKSEYLAYTATRIAWSIKSGRVLFGRDISHVMLLHCTRLNADSIDDLAAILTRFRLRPVSLAKAMRDRAYRTPDTYSGKDGIDWLERWSITMRKSLPEEGDEDPPADIQAAYDRVDNDRTDSGRTLQ